MSMRCKRHKKIINEGSGMNKRSTKIGFLKKSGSLCDSNTTSSASEPAISPSGFVQFIDLDDLRGDDLMNQFQVQLRDK